MHKSIVGSLEMLYGKRPNVLARAAAKVLPPEYAPVVCWIAGHKPDWVVYRLGYVNLPWIVKEICFTTPLDNEFRGHGIRYCHGLFVETWFPKLRELDVMLIVFEEGVAA